MAIILNIETSTEVCSVSLAENGKTLFLKESDEGLNHSKLLTVFIEELFSENNFDINNIDAVAVSKGPGSYTGLRIGVSVAKGLCYGLGKPLIGIGSIEAMGHYVAKNVGDFYTSADGEELLFCPMIDARRMEVYTALFNEEGNAENEVTAEIIDENSFANSLNKKKVLFFGNGADKCRDKITHENAVFNGPDKTTARFMQNLAEIKYNKSEFEDVAYFEPFYLKDFVATIPKNKVLK
ncbi:tRNA (adenosine(37)-N6)-threonylcarbamoyltransferase complex dimerization subunit type 1 TsaB [Draconibacterium sp. IB214405]|uniref:tRNA (adenosine(37)-N6)-threonylcarbamoyltransferase complex dimerization subunit type 1 TsaB n=1 Tax=Draconibacterium sp. IB214405 TaxID=3097352 RepID=UPI002A0D1C4C|nr:tRNA (adenosine(37)-N6)-threonylcarbamoyltransferase complex dimerization subunit type 1 TsaB [Draconibacterium sp. IB214405]MDX8337701.1 tRNA (adenosine(37)-N6)-threonylcarbamoyltransferase complex dimerization subunit type 1 TsaB [Draconibacterium sp. IB214405]